MGSDLITRAREIRRELPLDDIYGAGLGRRRDSYFLNITYPPLQLMKPMIAATVLDQIRSRVREVALYVHIPFCTHGCYYCHYYKVLNVSEGLVESYLWAIGREIEKYERLSGGLVAKSIYIGGGTPSYLNCLQIKSLFRQIRQHVVVDEGAEITFEVHPESATSDRLEALRTCGVNRVSMGVESFDDDVLRSENRGHDSERALKAYEAILAAGFDNVNLDLIYGLRGQTVEIWEHTLDNIRVLQPPSMTAYYLRLRTGTPDTKLYKGDAAKFPSEEDLLLMHIMTFEAMKTIGYEQPIVDWFVRTAHYFHRYQDHNWRSSDRIALLGVGTSAYSYVGGIQFYNVNDLASYINCLNKNTLPIWRGAVLSQVERMRRTAVLGLKMGINRQAFKSTYGVDFCEEFPSPTKRLEDLELVTVTRESVRLTYLGALFADEICRQYYSVSVKTRMEATDPWLISTTHPKLNVG